MQRYLILAQSETTAAALANWRQLLVGQEALTPGHELTDAIVVSSSDRSLDRHGIETYWDVVRRLEELVKFTDGYRSNQNIVMLVDAISPHQLDPLAEARTWGKLIAMLVLTFPEIHWYFALIEKDAAVTGARASEVLTDAEYGILAAFRPPRSALFDPFGLRDVIRQYAGKTCEQQHEAHYLPLRRGLAIALDEEPAYAVFHAYTAYRFGFRAVPISSATLAEHLLGKGPASVSPDLAFEDIYTSFADGEVGMSDLAGKRNEIWPKLQSAKSRIFVTAGQQRDCDTQRRESNERYIALQRRLPARHVARIFKPYAGLFDLWRRSGLARHRSVFPWPLKDRPICLGVHSHSTPGVLLLIAEKLLDRAKRLLPGVCSVEDAVRGAVLATDALELLGGRTPTVAVEALRLKHQYEVLAECQFSGIEYDIRLRERFAEIRRDVRAVSAWFHRKRHTNAALNAEMRVLLALLRLFQEYGRFDEEETCRNRIRHLHNRLWISQNPIRWLFWPVLRYLELLLGSFPVFIVVLLAWVAGLSLLYRWALGGHPTPDGGVFDAISSFFSNSIPIHPTKPPIVPAAVKEIIPRSYAFVVCLAIVSGFFHLGVFISHVYSMLARKS